MNLKPVSWVKANPLTTALFAIALLGGGWYFANSITAGIRHIFENRTVQQLEQKATKAETKAAEHLNEIDQVAASRAAEDLNRALTIIPEIDRSTRTVTETRERARRAQTNYDKARTKPDPGNDPDTAALHSRNCADLRELYPGEQHPICDR